MLRASSGFQRYRTARQAVRPLQGRNRHSRPGGYKTADSAGFSRKPRKPVGGCAAEVL